MGVALRRWMYREVRDRYPGHEAILRPASVVQPVAEHRHGVEQWRKPEIDIERSREGTGVSSRVRQRCGALLLDLSVPRPVTRPVQIQLADPAVASGHNDDSARHEPQCGLELVLKPVGLRLEADREPICAQTVRAEVDQRELGAKLAVLVPSHSPVAGVDTETGQGTLLPGRERS